MNSRPSAPRVDAGEKIRGEALFIRDESFPGLWFGTTIRSPHPHARILQIRFDPIFDWRQVVVVTAADVPDNCVAILENDMPFLAEEWVNYVGEPVLLLAAESIELLRQAEQHVLVKYEPLPALLNMHESEDSALRIFGESNVFKEIHIKKGNLESAKREADAVVEIETFTGFQEHVYLEPQGVVAIAEGTRVTIRGSMQCPFYVKEAVDTMFAGERFVTVTQATTGGAFGGKEDLPSLLAGHAALLAVKSGHPVAMFYDRQEDVRATSKRHPSCFHHVAYIKKNGLLLGLDTRILLDGGAYCTLSPLVLARAALTATGCYYLPNVRVLAKVVASNTVPSGAFRGFGGPQAVFAIEMLMEKIAAQMGLAADEVRRVNLIRKGQDTASGQRLGDSVSARETFEDALQRASYRQKVVEYRSLNQSILKKLREGRFPKRHPSDRLRGIGISTSLHGIGFFGMGENILRPTIRLRLDRDGRVVLVTSTTEIGQGQRTSLLSILARALQVGREDVSISTSSTDEGVDSGPTVASRTTMIVGSLVAKAAGDLIDRLLPRLERVEGETFEWRGGAFVAGSRRISLREAARRFSDIKVDRQYGLPPTIQFNEKRWRGAAYPAYSWAAGVAEVEVDPVTFETQVVRYTTTHEVGRAINRALAQGQIEGGTLQGIGYALYEKIGRPDGEFDVSGFTDYIIPTPTEMPEFDVNILENPYPYGPFGAKGLGELPFVGAAPAVVSALWMIFGEEFNRIPILPEDLAALFENAGATHFPSASHL